MATLPIRAPIVPALAGFGRVISFIVIFFKVVADAQRQAEAAHARYPFAGW
ncbi:MAG TPA: hypothetical protein VGQ63_20425 [Pseudolabrys sp.]|jgi:hypothetical protein|nr:hypothetical protein [Pseudolabrys sp.]